MFSWWIRLAKHSQSEQNPFKVWWCLHINSITKPKSLSLTSYNGFEHVIILANENKNPYSLIIHIDTISHWDGGGCLCCPKFKFWFVLRMLLKLDWPTIDCCKGKPKFPPKFPAGCEPGRPMLYTENNKIWVSKFSFRLLHT